MLEKNAKIFIAGHRGLVGSAIWNNLQQRGYTNLVGRSHKELDLLDGTAVKKFFDEERPEAVVLPPMWVALWQTCNTGRTLSIRICKSSRT